MPSTQQHPSSYRDPSGFLFYSNDILYRQVNRSFKEDFELMLSSGLYDQLSSRQLIIAHEALPHNLTGTEDWYTTLRPEFIPFISFPYEWCFDMWKDAALTSLAVAREAMQYGMMLKDASAYNVQWHKGRMTFIDSLSFERYDPQQPWIAYHQFCMHFLAPLALMHYHQQPMQSMFIGWPDGIPLPLAKKLLPAKSKWNLNSFLHLHLHGSTSEKNKSGNQSRGFSAVKMKNLLRSLEEAVRAYSFSSSSGVWSGYYEEAAQREDYLAQKKELVAAWTAGIAYTSAIDLGANEGTFSLLLAEGGKEVISVDFDHYSVNNFYKAVKTEKHASILPLVMDLSHPSPSIGVNNRERMSFLHRAKAGLICALALIHHLCIGKNIPFPHLATMFRNMGKFLLIEFVPLEDEKVKLMLSQKKNVYDWYTEENFVDSFSQHYKIQAAQEIGASKRKLYRMEAYEQ